MNPATSDPSPIPSASREDTEEPAAIATPATSLEEPSVSLTESDVAGLVASVRQASAPAAEDRGEGQEGSQHQQQQDLPRQQQKPGQQQVQTEAEAEAQAPVGDSETQEDAAYWDAEAMSPLTAQSAAAIARLRAYKPPPFPTWDRLPVSRRAAVLLLLYADRRGDLRVVITMRAASLRSYSGHAAFPGGKADTIHETPYQIARREAFEEIGLPANDARLPRPFRIEPLCELPCNIAQTEIIVRPCVAFLHADQPKEAAAAANANKNSPRDGQQQQQREQPGGAGGIDMNGADHNDHDDGPLVEETMIPRLDAKEVAAVFSAPFHNFLLATDENGKGRRPPPSGHWYDGRWVEFRTSPWRVHNFYVPVDSQRVQKPKPEAHSRAASPDDRAGGEVDREGGSGDPAMEHAQVKVAEKLEEEEERIGRYKVWGMTAHVLVDAARLAYDEVPEFEHNPHYGDEGIILQAEREGRLVDKKRKAEGDAGDGDAGTKKVEPAKM